MGRSLSSVHSVHKSGCGQLCHLLSGNRRDSTGRNYIRGEYSCPHERDSDDRREGPGRLGFRAGSGRNDLGSSGFGGGPANQSSVPEPGMFVLFGGVVAGVFVGERVKGMRDQRTERRRLKAISTSDVPNLPTYES